MQKLQHIGSIKDLRSKRDSVGVRSSGSGLKSECPENFSSEPDLVRVARFRTGVKFSPGTRTGVNSRRGDSRWHDMQWKTPPKFIKSHVKLHVKSDAQKVIKWSFRLLHLCYFITFMLTLKEVWDLSFLFARLFQPEFNWTGNQFSPISLQTAEL